MVVYSITMLNNIFPKIVNKSSAKNRADRYHLVQKSGGSNIANGTINSIINNTIASFFAFIVVNTTNPLSSILSSNKATAEELTIKTAQQYYLDGIYGYVDRNYVTSSEQFEALSKNYPYSKYTHDSLIMEAFLNYINDEREKTNNAIEAFYKLFPSDKYTPYMMYLNAMSCYKVVKDEMRSLDSITEAIQLFKELIETYPNTDYAKDAEQKIKFLEKLKQLNDISVGEFYEERLDYIGAMRRYTNMFKTYGNNLSPDIEERALCRAMRLSKTLKLEKCKDGYEKLLRKKYKNSKCLIENKNNA